MGRSIMKLPVALAACALAGAAWGAFAGFEPVHDAWGWLVWGREITGLELDTSSGPSWKPFPVLVTTILAPLGEAAPLIWLAIVAFSWLAGAVLAWALVVQLSGGGGRWAHLGGAAAAAGLLLLRDETTPWFRQMTGGLAEPILVASVLAAVLAALRGRHHHALGWSAVGSLVRPEAWPFAALYAWRVARSGSVAPWIPVTLGLAVLVAWFVPDLAGSGNALEGAERARGTAVDPEAGAKAILRGLAIAPLALAATLGGLALLPPGRDRAAVRVLAVGAIVLVFLVAAMAIFGFAGLARFMEPAGAIFWVLAGVALAAALAARRTLPATAIAVTLLAGLTIPLLELPGQMESTSKRSEVTTELTGLAADPAIAAYRGCAPVSVTDRLNRTALAWELELPMAAIEGVTEVPASGLLFAGTTVSPPEGPGPVAVTGRWSAYALSGCDGTGTTSAAEAGARR